MYELIKYNQKFQNMVLEWRNKDRIRKVSKNNNIITYEEHNNWIKRVDLKYLFLFKCRDKLIGIGQINKVDHSSAYWSCYIGADDAIPGSGAILNLSIIKIAFEKFKMEYLYGEVLSNNPDALNMQIRLGFKMYNNLSGELFREGEKLIIYHLGMTSKKWTEIRSKYENIFKRVEINI